MITLVLADDEPNVRRALRMRLELEPDIVVTGEAGDGFAVLDVVEDVRPDVVVMDVAMPRLDGIAAAERIRTVAPATRVVVLTLHDDPATMSRAHAAGAAGFVGKHQPPEALIDAIRGTTEPAAAN